MRDRSWAVRLALSIPIATGLYFAHLLALALYGVILGAYEVFGRSRAWRTPVRDWLVFGAQFVPAAALWLQLSMPPPRGDTGISWVLEAKPVVLASPFLFGGGAGGWSVGLPLFALCAFLVLRLTRTGALRWNRALAAPALALMVMGLAVPTRMFGVVLVDLRFPVAGACLAIAALSITPGLGRRLMPIAAALAAAMLIQTGSAATDMLACSNQYAELRVALQAVPRGEVLTAVAEYASPAPGVPCTILPIYDHVSQLITLDRSGYSPDFFGYTTSVKARGGQVSDTDPIPAHLLTADMLPQQGYVLWMHLGNRTRPIPPKLIPLRNGSFFDLFAIS